MDGFVNTLSIKPGRKADGKIYEFNGQTYVGGIGGETYNTYSGVDTFYSAAIGEKSHAEGQGWAIGYLSHAEGSGHAEGSYSHAENSGEAYGSESHAEGLHSEARGNESHAEGYYTVASGDHSHSEGHQSEAQGEYSHAEGGGTVASGRAAHAEGLRTTASANQTHAEGYETTASANYSHAEGNSSTASGEYSHAEGLNCKASGYCSHAEGDNAKASGAYAHAQGYNTTATNAGSFVSGHHNSAMIDGGGSTDTVGDAVVIGNGTRYNVLSNCFRVTYAGAVYGLSSYNSSGADYAEYFEWLDGNVNNEDRIGYFVTLLGEKIVKAKAGDYILGVVSGQPCIIGNADEDWIHRWEHDDFGRFIKEDTYKLKKDEYGHPIEGEYELDEQGNRIINGWKYTQNPNYDPSQQYIERKDRKEWSAVGMLGVLAVRDDGTCIVNGYAQVTDQSTATRAEVPAANTYRVIKRTANNVVQIIFR